ncbi:hypothetical protein J4229_01785 [Candidatus Pacearchaeota archaeon]|nr:hypothetical protein [Candidatus Pacearchaeota archaeon]
MDNLTIINMNETVKRTMDGFAENYRNDDTKDRKEDTNRNARHFLDKIGTTREEFDEFYKYYINKRDG